MKTNSRKNAVLFIFRFIIFVILAGLSVFLVKNRDEISLQSLKEYSLGLFGTEGTETEKLEFSPDSYNSFSTFADGLAVLSPTNLILLDKAGNERSTDQLDFAKPVLRVAGRYLLAYDVGGRGIVSAETYRTKIPAAPVANIFFAEINSTGWFIIATDEIGSKAAVTVYDSIGNEVYKWYSSEQYLTCAAISPNSESMVLGGLKQSGAQIKSELISVRFDDEEPVFRYPVDDSIILDVKISSDGAVVVLSEKGATFLDRAGKPLGKYEYGTLKLSGYSMEGEDFIVLRLTGSEIGDASTLVVLSYTGDILATKAINNVLDLAASEGEIGVLTSDHIVVYNGLLEEQFRTETFAGSNRVLMRNDRSLFLLNSSEAILYKW